MLFINTVSYYDNNNDFRLKEVLVSDGRETYSLSPEDSFEPHRFPFSLEELIESSRYNISYPVLGFNKTRTHPDTDAKALATFLSKKLKNLKATTPREEKVIFDIMAGFGNE